MELGRTIALWRPYRYVIIIIIIIIIIIDTIIVIVIIICIIIVIIIAIINVMFNVAMIHMLGPRTDNCALAAPSGVSGVGLVPARNML